MSAPAKSLSAELAAMAGLYRDVEAQQPGAVPLAGSLIGWLQIASARAYALERLAQRHRAEAEAYRAGRAPALRAAEATGKLAFLRPRPRAAQAWQGGDAA